MRLSDATAAHLPASIIRPNYNRSAQKCGIVHFGIGAFHRAHQAVYTDDAMNAGDRDWGITGISLRSASVARQMNPQGGHYTVNERSSSGDASRLIGAVQSVLVAMPETPAVVAAIAAPTTHIISFTITETGYCRAADGSLDLSLNNGVSIYTYLTAGFRRRMDARLPGLTILSCDNLSGNGAQLAALMSKYLSHNAPDLLRWFERECTCPATMVDRIVPATTPEDRDRIAMALGMRDEAAVLTEAFSQWVIEDKFAGARPRWDVGGAQFVVDVAPYETAKLRMLNGAHSALAYLGLARGHDFVHQAIADPALRLLVETLMRNEAATSFTPAPGQDLDAYADALLARFANRQLNHRLAQIAMDGSQKVPQRWLETLKVHQDQGRACPTILSALAAWIVHVRGDARPVDDPMAAELATLWTQAGKDGIAAALFGPRGRFGTSWQANDADLACLSNRL